MRWRSAFTPASKIAGEFKQLVTAGQRQDQGEHDQPMNKLSSPIALLRWLLAYYSEPSSGTLQVCSIARKPSQERSSLSP